ncbi:hypothetical protein BJ138DRAFT_1081323 [Hygrophoropsis aurantiaca]|uniref:Uncharacterized protein n=1 Tax=Hygrophoropsis aurantiaca TaxID=72124 RepID=A0ACB8AK94_9AGAM|nr:hypothetical protein BJ138DRAFT_1081323 [Hygrophoropsis aurantiaca]
MSRVLAQRSFENFALLQAASEGNLSGVRDALKSGADINASDHSGRTVLTCALTADRWETIDASDASFMSDDRLDALRLVVSHPDISLYTLNAPQDSINDVTPLGMAAWLDMPLVVDVLLECSAGAVSVDGMDTDGATPLMYASRDGRFEVVQQLLAHAARPDSRDRNHRSAIQFALPHPRILWLCEYALRCHRWREHETGNKRSLISPTCVDINLISPYIAAPPSPSFPTPDMFSPQLISHFTDSLVQAVLTSDLPVIYSLLFPSSFDNSITTRQPVVVNLPDAEGWSAIHYCVSVQHPSIEVLDALYRAGADVSLFTTTEDYTPLHCLAQLARIDNNLPESSRSLCQFIVHLIRDLRAPLSARDRDEETCIHIAAEHGHSIDVLIAFLECDTTGAIRNLRNSRGLTPFEVAKPHFRSAFGEVFRPQSSLSDRTIRPAASLASITSFSSWASPSASVREASQPSTHLPHDFDVTSSSERLLDNFHHVSKEMQFARDPVELDTFQGLLKDTSQIGVDVLSYFRSQCDDVAKELRDMREVLNDIDRLWNTMSHDAEEQTKINPASRRLAFYMGSKRTPRGSEDSQTTAVEVGSNARLPSKEKIEPAELKDAAVQTDPLPPSLLGGATTAGARAVPWPEWLDSFVLSADSNTYKAHLAGLIEIEQELLAREATASLEERVSLKEPKLRSLLKSRKRYEKVEKSGASKLKAWLKKKIIAEKPLKLQISYDLADQGCAVGREVKRDPSQVSIVPEDCQKIPAVSLSQTLEYGVLSSHAVLTAASRDLSAIDENLHGVDHLISTACHSISRAERIIKRTIKTQESSIEKLRLRHVPVYDDIFAFSTNKVHNSSFSGIVNCSGYLSPPRSNTSSRSSSAQSSTVSLASTLREDEDEDSRVLRRLLLRKIGARVDGAFDEIDRANVWLRIVKEVLRDLKNRTTF